MPWPGATPNGRPTVETAAERLRRFRGYALEERRKAEALAEAGIHELAASYRDGAARYAALCQRWEREADLCKG